MIRRKRRCSGVMAKSRKSTSISGSSLRPGLLKCSKCFTTPAEAVPMMESSARTQPARAPRTQSSNVEVGEQERVAILKELKLLKLGNGACPSFHSLAVFGEPMTDVGRTSCRRLWLLRDTGENSS